jgi:hypothetical protein
MPQVAGSIEPGPNWKPGHGPIRNTVRTLHRAERQFWDEDEPAALEEPLAKVLFSTRPEDLGLYNKPLGRNVQMWTSDYHLLLDGQQASSSDLENAVRTVGLGGRFGYRFGPPAMRVGTHELYWHRPLVACRAGCSGRCTFIDEAAATLRYRRTGPAGVPLLSCGRAAHPRPARRKRRSFSPGPQRFSSTRCSMSANS